MHPVLTEANVRKRMEEFLAENPDSVLMPVLLEHFKDMVRISNDAWAGVVQNYGLEEGEWGKATDASDAATPLPGVLETWFLSNPSAPDSFWKNWQKAEQYLHEKGFTPDMVEFHDCGREAVVFGIKGVPDVLLKISKEYKLPSMVPFVLKPFSKAVFPLSVHEPQDHLHAVAEYDPQNVGKNTDNARKFGYTGQISIALIPYLHGNYANIQEVGVKAGTLENDFTHLTRDDTQEVMQKLRPEQISALQKIDIKGVRDFIKFFNRVDPWKVAREQDASLPKARYELQDIKVSNFRCLQGFPQCPFVIDKRAVDVIEKKPPLYPSSAIKEPEVDTAEVQRQKETYDAYYALLEALRQVYHERYGREDAAFHAVAERARSASVEDKHRSAIDPTILRRDNRTQGLPDL